MLNSELEAWQKKNGVYKSQPNGKNILNPGAESSLQINSIQSPGEQMLPTQGK